MKTINKFNRLTLVEKRKAIVLNDVYPLLTLFKANTRIDLYCLHNEYVRVTFNYVTQKVDSIVMLNYEQLDSVVKQLRFTLL